MEIPRLVGEPRTTTGKKTSQLRKKGIIPAVIFANDEDSVLIQLSAKEFEKNYKVAGHSTLVDLEIEGKTSKILIAEVQTNPRNRQFLHAMLHKVNLKEEITAEVPIEIIGEALGVKVEKGILVTPVAGLTIRCLPTDLPAVIIADISTLNTIGDSLIVANITLPKGVTLVHEEDMQLVLVTIAAPQLEVESTGTEATPEQVELSVKKGKEEKTEDKK